MRCRWVVSGIGVLAVALAGVIGHASHPKRPAPLPSSAPAGTLAVSASTPSTAPVAGGFHDDDVILMDASGNVMDAHGQQYWADPSLDPQVMERAYPPPPPASALAEEARPRAPAITPPPREWRKLQQRDDLVLN